MTIKVDNLTKIYSASSGLSVKALDEVSFSLPEKGLVIVTGESGSGKTTLMNILGGLISPSSGNFLFNERNNDDITEIEWDKLRNEKIGFVLQNYALIEGETVNQNLCYVKNINNMTEADFEREKDIALEAVGMSGCGTKRIYELSGGQKQRIAIARALFKQPEIILADEPTGNLDSENSQGIFNLLQTLAKERLVLVVCHDIKLTREFADREIRLKDGKIVADINYSDAKADAFLFSSDNDSVMMFQNENEITEEFIKCRTEKKRKTFLVNFFPASGEIIDLVDNDEKSGTTSLKKDKSSGRKEYSRGFSERSISLTTRLRLAVLSIVSGRKRTLPTFICVWIACFVLFVFLTFLFNDFPFTVYRYFRDNKISKAVVNMEHSPLARNTRSDKIQFGEYLYDRLDEIEKKGAVNAYVSTAFFSNYQTNIASLDSVEDEKNDKFCLSVGLQNNMSDLNVLYGRLPQSVNEFAISEAAAEECNVTPEMLGNTFYLRDEEAVLTGIVSNSGGFLMINSTREEINAYYSNLLVNVAYVCSDFWNIHAEMDIKENRPLTLYEANVLCSVNLTQYLTAAPIDILGITRSDGRPLKQNEVIVSVKYADEHDLKPEDLPKRFVLKDLYSEKYNTSYYDRINMEQYLDGTIYVVEIIEDCSADLYINPDIFTALVYDDYAYYVTEIVYNFPSGKATYEVLKNMEDKNIRITDPNLEKMYQLSFGINEYFIIGLALTGFLILLTIGIYWLFLMSETSTHRSKIGILRILGTGKNDVASLFLLEGLILVAFAIGFALITLVVSLHIINAVIAEKMRLTPYYDMLGLNVPVILPAAIALLLFFGAITYFAVRRLGKKELFSLLHD